jgi:hypothetical protein
LTVAGGYMSLGTYMDLYGFRRGLFRRIQRAAFDSFCARASDIGHTPLRVSTGAWRPAGDKVNPAMTRLGGRPSGFSLV